MAREGPRPTAGGLLVSGRLPAGADRVTWGDRPPRRDSVMLLRTALAVALLAGSCLLAAADELELNPYISADGKYKVLLPGEVKTVDKKMAGTVTKSATATVGSDA